MAQKRLNCHVQEAEESIFLLYLNENDEVSVVSDLSSVEDVDEFSESLSEREDEDCWVDVETDDDDQSSDDSEYTIVVEEHTVYDESCYSGTSAQSSLYSTTTTATWNWGGESANLSNALLALDEQLKQCSTTRNGSFNEATNDLALCKKDDPCIQDNVSKQLSKLAISTEKKNDDPTGDYEEETVHTLDTSSLTNDDYFRDLSKSVAVT